MRVLNAFPPNYAAINQAFNVRGKPVIFAYGGTIYNPSRIAVGPHLIAHETVHGRRQSGDPERWWSRYIEDRAFRLDEEIVAHAAEYRHFRDRLAHGSRLADILQEIAWRLASPMYGSLIGVDDAKQRIAQEVGVEKKGLAGEPLSHDAQ